MPKNLPSGQASPACVWMVEVVEVVEFVLAGRQVVSVGGEGGRGAGLHDCGVLYHRRLLCL